MPDNTGSRYVAAAAVALAITKDRESERSLRAQYASEGLKTAAVDFGGEFIASVGKIIEHAIVAARREGVIADTHLEEGAVAGAVREALSQIMSKAIGLNIGGKIAVVRRDEHICAALFFGIGLLHLNEVAIGLGHRVV